MDESVLVTTHDLPLAGQLRSGFRHAGYRVELFTAAEDLADVADPALLVITGGADTESAQRQARDAARRELPLFVVGPGGAASGLPPQAPASVTRFAPPADPEEIVLVGVRAIKRRRLRAETGIVGEADAMIEVMERMIQIAPVDATVLVTGESGTGKELVARGLLALSRRRHRSFIPVNIAALSETLLESELFGHEKGAFTGAIDARKGLFELASGGTIFLDEIGEMSLATQTRLLRVIEQQEFHRVGGQRLIRVDARVIAATNQRLDELVVAGRFRKDLYYRINVLTIALPPLRERRSDIPLLVNHFIRDATKRYDRRKFRGISREAMDILVGYRWPGNVRELRNLVDSMVVLAPGREIRAEDIPENVRSGDRGLSLVPVAGAGFVGGGAGGGGGEVASLRPQLEFIFRTMMEMKVDIDDLRREFEHFQAGARGEGGPDAGRDRLALPVPDQAGEIVVDRWAGAGEGTAAGGGPGLGGDEAVVDAVPAAGQIDSAGTGVSAGAGASASETVLAANQAVGAGDAATPPDEAASASGDAATPPGDAASAAGGAASAAGGAASAAGRAATSAPGGAAAPSVGYREGMTLREMEREVVRSVLESVDGHRKRAAAILGIGERTLYRKVKSWGLDED